MSNNKQLKFNYVRNKDENVIGVGVLDDLRYLDFDGYTHFMSDTDYRTECQDNGTAAWASWTISPHSGQRVILVIVRALDGSSAILKYFEVKNLKEFEKIFGKVPEVPGDLEVSFNRLVINSADNTIAGLMNEGCALYLTTNGIVDVPNYNEQYISKVPVFGDRVTLTLSEEQGVWSSFLTYSAITNKLDRRVEVNITKKEFEKVKHLLYPNKTKDAKTNISYVLNGNWGIVGLKDDEDTNEFYELSGYKQELTPDNILKAVETEELIRNVDAPENGIFICKHMLGDDYFVASPVEGIVGNTVSCDDAFTTKALSTALSLYRLSKRNRDEVKEPHISSMTEVVQENKNYTAIGSLKRELVYGEKVYARMGYRLENDIFIPIMAVVGTVTKMDDGTYTFYGSTLEPVSGEELYVIS